MITENVSQILIVLVLATAAIIIVKRDILSLVKTYALQSLLLAVMALLFFTETGSLTLLCLAAIIIVSKVIVIPYFMGHVYRRLNIKRDVQFHFLSPITSLITSIFIVLSCTISFSSLLSELNLFDSNYSF
jgi:hydrogenase-4 component E